MYSNQKIQEKDLEYIRNIVGEQNVCVEDAELIAYAQDVSIFFHKPDVVCICQNVEQIQEIVKFANKNKIPIVPRGAGSGTAGGAVPIKGGIVLDLTRMNEIKEIDEENLTVRVGAGVVISNLNQELKKYGLHFPVDLGSSDMATIGGTIGNSGGGMRAVKYGTIKNWVLSLKAVLPNGDVIQTRNPTIKNVVGYDLTSLLIGSEGTLGIIAEAVLRISPIPEHTGVLMAAYNDLQFAGHTTINVLKKITPTAIEILDKSAIVAVKKYSPTTELPDVEAILLFEIDGTKEEVETKLQAIQNICQKNGAVETKWSDDPLESERIWEARRMVGAAVTRLREGYSRVYVGDDITVPMEKIPVALVKLRNLSEEFDMSIVSFGHIADGNIHTAITIDKSEDEQWNRLEKLKNRIYDLALNLGGTTSGEHGIGLERAHVIEEEIGKETLNLMRTIKRAIDPNNIMNPGKMGLD